MSRLSKTIVAISAVPLAAATAVLVIGGTMSLKSKFIEEVAAAGLQATGEPGPVVTEADIAQLPETAQRYLRFMGVVGRPRDTSFRAHYTGRFRPNPKTGWMKADIWQFNSQPDVARYFYMTLPFFGVVPVLGRDIYVNGQGRMLIRPLDLFTVEDAKGSEFDIGELVTYLNDAFILAPGLLLAPNVRFEPVDDRSFDLTLTDHGMTVRARAFVDEKGMPKDFETTDRFFGPTLERTRWTTPIDGYQFVDGRALPTTGRAVWHTPEGEYVYAELEFRPDSITFNVAPGK